jgi:hypothetical protein
MENTSSDKQKTFRSNDGLVCIKSTTQPRRWPPHNFPVVVVELKPERGTRVLTLPDGRTEWMPRYSELLALILKLGLKVSSAPPDKPEERRLKFQRINARRHTRRAE